MTSLPGSLNYSQTTETIFGGLNMKDKFVCATCNKKFAHISSLRKHRQNEHGAEHTCQLCKKRLEHSENIRQHMRIHHNLENVFICGCCNFTFSERKHLLDHQLSLKRTGTPGTAMPIGKTDHALGTLKQSVARTIPKHRNSVGSLSPSTSTSTSSRGASKSPIPEIQGKEDPFEHTAKLQKVDESMSVSTTTSLVSTKSRVSSKSQLQEIPEEYQIPDVPMNPPMKLFNDAVDSILQSGQFTYNQITLPETWQEIVIRANELVVHQLSSPL